MRNAIPARAKLEVALRYLAASDSYQSISLLFRIPACTISRFMPEVLEAITTALSDYMKAAISSISTDEVDEGRVLSVPQTQEEWVKIQKNFETKWNFPSCCGAIDGKHVAIKRPPGSCSEFFNYKGGYSVILLALVDADCKFMYIDVGSNGRANDGNVFRLSTLKSAMDNNQLDFPNDYIIVADDAFPLSPNMMKPFSRRNLDLKERIFNYRLSRARRVVENAFGILAARFRIFGKEIEVDLPTVDLIVKCACTIHNWLRTTSPGTYFERGWVDYEDIETGICHPGQWRTIGVELPSITGGRKTNSYSKRASDIRKKLADYFSAEGQVSWQLKAIGM
ncbi:uncharacterized protein LOC128984640 [Macrosteles quadrilineatus]|uniref:uncharacterized protein LOC128984639 n=1 Tax=Macrosteles quadrilineatus TaxID=74068 RepID=UPI0023E1D362|nr:uncharacterized protein LOC128984639 [Macrosteles quadrilineatus]XP_054259950.1 uncharacterized protein LOC128984640 [Macrosteles quadrilineatus]